MNVVKHTALLIVFVALCRTDSRAVDFEEHVQPILQRHCIKCHGSSEQEGGLRLDRRASIRRGGDSGEPTIVPNKPDESFLIRLVSGKQADLKMPPEGPGLSKQEMATLRAWISAGAKMPADSAVEAAAVDHWSFRPILSVTPPTSEDPFVANPIDAFVLRELAKSKVPHSRRADRLTRLRRLYLVMHGMPPTREQIQRFITDGAENAWQTAVTDVLDSPRYGERWARHWLDLVRFGETHGFETNRERPHAWPFRDYVIESFNSDKPYDQFVREQIAGDAVGAPVGTGFLVAGPYDLVKGGGNLVAVQRLNELDDMINTTGTTFLGLTLGCARCHNHKFDPVTQTDYYAMQAVFAGVNHADRDLPPSAEHKAKLAEFDARIDKLRTQLEQFIAAPPKGKRPAVTATFNAEEFPAVEARFVRFTIRATNNGSQPCLDELEVFCDGKNVALASLGVRASSSSNLPGYEIHKLQHINDGKFGNGRSWISNEAGRGWVQLEFPSIQRIDRLHWARDREGKYADRLATNYTIEVAAKRGQWREVASSADRQAFANSAPAPKYDFDDSPPKLAQQGRSWLAELKQLEATRKHAADALKVYAGTFTQPGPTHRLYRGEPDQKREVVGPNAVAALTTLELENNTPEQQRRLALANWIADKENPLTARVIVNRLWQHHFGAGLVDTPNDFGANGTRPTHPELLDWLATELMTSGWSLKHVHQLILMSSTWQQDSRPSERGMAADASSRLLWRFPPRRLEAEAIRDSMLAVAGVLDLRMGGPGFSGFEVQMENVRHFFPKRSYGPEDWRRMIYMTKVRQEQESVFGAFDCPDASQVAPKRSRSTTPLQAFNLFNSMFVIQQSELFSQRLEREAPQSDPQRANLAFELAFGRPATSQEANDAHAFALKHGWPALCRALLNANEFVFIP